jgi:hypothetical protein
MLGVMYRITKDANGVILVCLACPHTECVTELDGDFGSPRTQAACAMLKHVRNQHGKQPIVKPMPQVMERMY